MSRQTNLFEDIVQPQPRSARQLDFQDNPFDDNDPFDNAAQVGLSSGTQAREPTAGQHGYALDPFFDESVVRSLYADYQ